MPKTEHKIEFRDIPAAYADLVAMHPPRPIHDSVDYENTMEIVMAMAGHELTADQEDYLEVLSGLIHAYDQEHDPRRSRGSVLQRLKYLVKESGMTTSDLGRLLGGRTMGSLLLTGRRELSKTHIRKLSKHFKVRADYFL